MNPIAQCRLHLHLGGGLAQAQDLDLILPTRAFAVIRIVLRPQDCKKKQRLPRLYSPTGCIGTTHSPRPQDCNSDFILIILKQLLAYTRPDLRLVLMSATVEVPSHPLAIHLCASTLAVNPSPRFHLTVHHPHIPSDFRSDGILIQTPKHPEDSELFTCSPSQ